MLMSVFFDYRIMIRNEKIEVSREKKLAHGSEVSFAINLVKISKTPISNSNFKNSNRVSLKFFVRFCHLLSCIK